MNLHPMPNDIRDMQRLAGIGASAGYQLYQGSNISVTANEKAQLQKTHNIRPGTDAWFRLWFSLPYLTGETPMDGQP